MERRQIRPTESGMRNGGATGDSSRRFRRFVCALFGLLAALSVCGTRSGDSWAQDAEKTPESEARKKQREENLKLMEQRASDSKIRRADKDQTSAAELVASPLFHYTDQPRRIIDATLWGWTSEGRLLAICKIENYERGAHREGEWLYCCGSLATGLVEAEFADGHRWSARKPGIELRPIADGPVPSAGKPARLRQMKDLASRFSATIIDVSSTVKQEMRLLPRPIYRYEKGTDALLDGAVFGLTTNGTNPDAILVIELHEPEAGAGPWRFGLAGMTQEQLFVKFDGKEVWSKPFVRTSGNFDTWTFFWENSK